MTCSSLLKLLPRRSNSNPIFSPVKEFFLVGFRGISTTSSLQFYRSSTSKLPNFFSSKKPNLRDEFEVTGSSSSPYTYSVIIEAGKRVSPLDGSSVVATLEEQGTTVLSCVSPSKTDHGPVVAPDIVPSLTVDYQGNPLSDFMRSDGGACIIDRSIRPLFPAGYYDKIQVTASVLSCDGKYEPDVMVANATSAALMLSDIQWDGPVGVVRIGRYRNVFIVNPSMDQLSLCDLNLVYACTRDKTLVVDVQAREISERDLEQALRFAHREAAKYLDAQIRLAEHHWFPSKMDFLFDRKVAYEAKAGMDKVYGDYDLSMVTERTQNKVKSLAEASIESVHVNPEYRKGEYGEALKKIRQNVKQVLELPEIVDTVTKEASNSSLFRKALRADGRRLDEVRPLHCESGNVPLYHGSSLLSREDTKVLCTVTQRTPGDDDAQCLGIMDRIPVYKYLRPPFSVSEVHRQSGLNGLEAQRCNLVEKALLGVLCREIDFPNAVHVNSEVKHFDGSTSMTTVCGVSLALMDAGIPLRRHVAGISVGLVSGVESTTGLTDYRILTDLSGLEDHLVDMDLKVAGTRQGVTAVQLDMKHAGVPLDVVCDCLAPALNGRPQILDLMEREINVPRFRIEQDWYWSYSNSISDFCIGYYELDTYSVERLVESEGAHRRKIEQTTGARISVMGDGVIIIRAKKWTTITSAEKMIKSIQENKAARVGEVYEGVVTSAGNFGV